MSTAVIVFAVSAAACLVAHVAILHAVVRSRTRIASDAAVPRPNLLVEIVWALVPAIVLAFVLTATWAKIRERPASPPAIMRLAR
jgi:heme/copper-type cytochrome/quinol oxidase subunit 2